MPINIYSVRNHLEEEGWKLVSDTYKNLDTELEMECPKGHRQKQTYKKWRKYMQCDECIAGAPFKGKENQIPKKGFGKYRILALDASTNITGYSVYDDNELVGYGIYKTNGENDVTERINEVKHWVEKMIEIHKPDILIIEDIQLQTYGHGQTQVKTYNTLARLQGVLLDTCFEYDMYCDLVYASEWRRACGIGEGTGREAKKKQAQDKVFTWYGLKCTQDEADAICIGKYCCQGKTKKNTGWGEYIE